MSQRPPRSFQRTITRRHFATGAAGLAAGAATLLASQAGRVAADEPQQHSPLIKSGATILFQGDSITDAGRNRDELGPNNHEALGKGYAWLAASQLLIDRPGDNLKILNRGISGNQVFQLVDRWTADCLELKPDVLSILIGINDFSQGSKVEDGGIKKYQMDYHALVKTTTEKLPEVKLVICEPFLARKGDQPKLAEYRAAAKQIAEEFGATFVPFQSLFDEAANVAPHERWAPDGVHPSSDGAALMANMWLKSIGHFG